MKYFVICVVAVLLQSQFTDSEDSQVYIVLKHSACTGNPKYVVKIMKPRKPMNTTTSISSFDLFLKPNVTLDSPLYAHAITYKKFATQYKPVMVKVKVELCDALRQKNHPLFAFFQDFLYINETDSNLMNPCPLKGHRFLRPYFTRRRHMLIPFLPVGMWRLDILVTTGKAAAEEEEVLKVVNYYEVTAKGIIEF